MLIVMWNPTVKDTTVVLKWTYYYNIPAVYLVQGPDDVLGN